MIDTFKLFQLCIALFITIFIIFPINLPLVIVSLINSFYGIIVIIIILFLLFIYTNPILGILFIIASYVAIQRSTQKIARIEQTQENTNFELKQMNSIPNNVATLEEQIVNLMSPIVPIDKPIIYLHSQFKPINLNIGSASIL